MRERTARWALWLPRLAAIIGICVVGACRRGETPQAPSTASSNRPVRVTGAEKVAWDQIAKDATEVGRYRYLAYVDDAAPVELGVTCAPTPTRDTFTCSAPLPNMRPGRHRLQLTTEEADNQKRRSPKSGVIFLDVVTKTP